MIDMLREAARKCETQSGGALLLFLVIEPEGISVRGTLSRPTANYGKEMRVSWRALEDARNLGRAIDEVLHQLRRIDE